MFFSFWMKGVITLLPHAWSSLMFALFYFKLFILLFRRLVHQLFAYSLLLLFWLATTWPFSTLPWACSLESLTIRRLCSVVFNECHFAFLSFSFLFFLPLSSSRLIGEYSIEDIICIYYRWMVLYGFTVFVMCLWS